MCVCVCVCVCVCAFTTSLKPSNMNIQTLLQTRASGV